MLNSPANPDYNSIIETVLITELTLQIFHSDLLVSLIGPQGMSYVGIPTGKQCLGQNHTSRYSCKSCTPKHLKPVNTHGILLWPN